MKIVFISSAENIHTIRWVNGLSAKGLDVHLISLKNHDNKYSLNKLNQNIKVTYLPIAGFKGYYLNRFFLNKIIKKINPDIVNVHYASGYGTLGRFIKFDKKLLNVWGSDVYDFPKESILKRKILIKNLNAFNYIASTSYCMAEEIRKYLKNKNQPVFITPFGVDLNRFKKIEKIEKSDEVVVGIVKALKEKYGIEYLIRALDYLINKRKISHKLKLKIYGGGILEKSLKELTKELKLEKYIEFKGKIENKEVPRAINNMDIFVVPSIFESFGVAAVEAMACETAVIVSNVGGLKEVVQNNITGYIVESENFIEIADKILEIIENKEQTKRMIINAKQNVLEKYSWDKNLDEMIKIYTLIKEGKKVCTYF